MKRAENRAWVGVIVACFVTGCSSFLPNRAPEPLPIPLAQLEIDDEVTELYAIMRHDWTVLNDRLSEIAEVTETLPPVATAPNPRPAPVPLGLTAESVLRSIQMPVSGVTRSQLDDSYGDPRDGGRRRHHGIDIKAPRGTRVLAVTDGEISYVGTQSKAGRSVWLVTDAGVSFFYAHLDRWANGLQEGMKVRRGDTIGYVGNTGNARRSSPHLHFAIHRHSRAINPYPYLVRATPTDRTPSLLAGGLISGSQ